MAKDCNTCTCENGEWKCTGDSCDVRCSAYGDPHYITFDGKKYGFMGKCSYYLVKSENFSIEAENVACDYGENHFNEDVQDSFSCTKSLTIRFKQNIYDRTIQLKQNKVVFIDGTEVQTLPKSLNHGLVVITKPSSSFVLGKDNY